MSYEEILEYAQTNGAEAAYGLTILLGPDNIIGGWNVYLGLINRLDKGEHA